MGGPTGPVIFPPGQYTHCVDRTNYRDVPGFLEAGVPSILEFTLCEYLLGGKLVCLAGGEDVCAIGVVAGIEEVGYQKSGLDAIDNDFSFNLLVLPYHPSDFAAYRGDPGTPATYESHKIRDDVVMHSPHGRLMVDPNPTPTPLPTPREPGGTSPMDGYGVLYRWNGTELAYDHDNQNNLHILWGKSSQTTANDISIPIVHCECEGSRIFFVCQAMKPFLEILQGKPPGSGAPSPGDVCNAALGWVPFGIGKAMCAFVEDLIAIPIALALAPAMVTAFATAWEIAQVYDDLFITGPVAKQINMGDTVVVVGRWTWDAGHAGQTELHPVKSIQKVELPPGLDGGHDPSQPLPTPVTDQINDINDRWCRLVMEAPPPPNPWHHGGLSGLSAPQVESLNPGQKTVYESQRRPENRWVVHPAIDGCLPED